MLDKSETGKRDILFAASLLQSLEEFEHNLNSCTLFGGVRSQKHENQPCFQLDAGL